MKSIGFEKNEHIHYHAMVHPEINVDKSQLGLLRIHVFIIYFVNKINPIKIHFQL